VPAVLAAVLGALRLELAVPAAPGQTGHLSCLTTDSISCQRSSDGT